MPETVQERIERLEKEKLELPLDTMASPVQGRPVVRFGELRRY